MNATAPALTDERVRMFYATAYAWCTEDSVEDGERDLSEMRARQGAEFDTWLAAHDAAVIARAKREERQRIADALEEIDSNDFAWRGMDVNTGMWAAEFIRRGCVLEPIGELTNDETD